MGISSETVGYITYEKLLSQMKADAEGRKILQRRQRISSDTLLFSKFCAPGTLGNLYFSFMVANGFHPNERPPVTFTKDGELHFVAVRAREIHDLLHVLFDCPTNLQGELALKAIEFVQYGLPAHWASTYFASFRLSVSEQHLLEYTFLPWAVRAASRAPNLICRDYEQLLKVQVSQLRTEWHISEFPRYSKGLLQKMDAGVKDQT